MAKISRALDPRILRSQYRPLLQSFYKARDFQSNTVLYRQPPLDQTRLFDGLVVFPNREQRVDRFVNHQKSR